MYVTAVILLKQGAVNSILICVTIVILLPFILGDINISMNVCNGINIAMSFHIGLRNIM